jgi:single-strand DNA-binding protein
VDIITKKGVIFMNNVLLTGRLTKDAELLDLKKEGTKAVKFTLAVERRYKSTKDDSTADFIQVTYFNNSADKLLEYLFKGRLISVSGEINVKSVEGEDGSRKYYTNIKANHIDFLDNKKSTAQ